jgi:rare lipoprotein A
MQGDLGSFHGLARRAGVLVVAALTLAACAETQLAVHTAKRVGGTTDVNPGSGSYKIGKPYQIGGRWYYPKEEYDYKEEGIASWYGPNFHGKATANGEVYDMNDLTAAHRTLPMPSVVRVTNLENGRALILRVNDRGPFAKERIIDVSRRGAQLLGFEGQGTTRVRVEILPGESIAMRDAILNGRGGVMTASAPATPVPAAPEPRVTVRAPIPAPARGPGAQAVTAPAPQTSQSVVATRLLPPPETTPVSSVAVTAPPIAQPAPVSTASVQVAAARDTFIQAGAFSSMANARRLEADLRDFGPTLVSPVESGGATLYRVRVGPLSDEMAARRVLDRMASAGYGNAVVVID